MNASSIKIRGTYENGVVIPLRTPDFKVREVFIEFVPQTTMSSDETIEAMAATDSQSWRESDAAVSEVRAQLVRKRFPFLFKK